MNIKEMASEIANARKAQAQTTMAWPTPAPTREQAMEIQTAAFDLFGSPSVGWKVGATAKAAQEAFKIDSPFYGPMAKACVLETGANLKKTACVGACEPEYAFKMSRDFPENGEVINAENIATAVADVHIVIEVIGRCIGNPDYANGIGVTMDFAGNAAFIIGPKVNDWQNQDLANTVVESKVDGAVVETGNGLPVMGDPINSLVWMAEQLVASGQTLKTGEWVSTGTCTAAVPAVAGTTYTATFGSFGDVSVNFV
ncbi:MAG: hypothetical protein V3V02_09695 [Rhizobiaceae bacterium]